MDGFTGKFSMLRYTAEKRPEITFELLTDISPEVFDGWQGKLLDITTRVHREKRSLSANAYCWVLCGELAKKLGIPLKEVYREEIRSSGKMAILQIKPEAFESFRRCWETGSDGNQVAPLTDSEGTVALFDGFIECRVWFGSSQYDTKEMSDFIDGIIQDCEKQGIPTISDDQLEKMKGEWR